jgi:hypothetical protein
VADDVARLRERLEGSDQPGDIVFLGGREPLGNGGSEARQRERHGVVALELREERLPDAMRIRHAVDEDCGHVTGL